MAQGIRPVVLGLVAGAAGALALSGVMASLLYEVTRLDLVAYQPVAKVDTAAAVRGARVRKMGSG